ncbi:hypothetical protein HZB74_01895 [Candidatus Saccharibacteria bacterium]|nr:hypothetical protein [Candidatus Saccharibacteria bacterium]
MERLEEPITRVVKGGVDRYLAVQQDLADGSSQVLGRVATRVGEVRYYDPEFSPKPVKVADATSVSGIIGHTIISKKDIHQYSYGYKIPFYGLRIKFAEWRAERRVLDSLNLT